MRPHPLYMFYDIKRWLWLLLIPLFRAVWMPVGSLSDILIAWLRDALIGVILLMYAVIKWRRTTYQIDRHLQIRKGILVRRHHILWSGSTALVAIETTPLMRLFGCRRIQISTVSKRRHADATLYVSHRDALPLSKQEIGAEGYHATTFPVLIMALSGSNAAIGAITLVPFIRRTATVLGERFSQDIYSLTERFISFDLPPILESVANLLLLGWCFSVISSLLRIYGFRVHRHGSRLHILSGAFTTRNLQMDTGCISSLLLRQTLFTRLLGLYTATIACAGYGREAGVRPVLIPAATMRGLCRALNQLLPGFPLGRVSVRPSIRSLGRYILPPIGLLGGAAVLYWFSDTITAIPTLIVLVAGIWWFFVRLLGFFYSGFGIQDGAVVMRYPRGLALYELHLPLTAVDRFSLRQNPFSRRRDRCTLRLLCFGEKRRVHRIWGLHRTAVETLLADNL